MVQLSGSRRGGGYLLSHFRSIIDVVRFNFSVRNGKRWSPHAIATLVRFQSSLSGNRLFHLGLALLWMPCKVKKRRYGSEVNQRRSLCLVSESVCSNLLCPPSLGRGVKSLNGSQRLCQRVPSDVLRLKLFRLRSSFVLVYATSMGLLPRKGLGD